RCDSPRWEFKSIGGEMSFVKFAGLAISALGLVAAGTASAQTTFKMNISVPQDSHYGVAVDTFAAEVEKRTNGRYKIQNFYASALGNEREAIEAVQLGTLDMAMSSTGPVPNFVPELAILDIRSEERRVGKEGTRQSTV